MTTAERLRDYGLCKGEMSGQELVQAADELEALTKERDELQAKLESTKSQMVELKRAFLSAENDVCAYRNKLAHVEADAAAMRDVIDTLIEDDEGDLVGREGGMMVSQRLKLCRSATSTGSGQRLLDELSTLRATAQRRLELLRKCEWSMPCAFDFRNQCPLCQGYIPEHKPDCPLAQELKEGKPEQYTEPIHDHGYYPTAMKKEGK